MSSAAVRACSAARSAASCLSCYAVELPPSPPRVQLADARRHFLAAARRAQLSLRASTCAQLSAPANIYACEGMRLAASRREISDRATRTSKRARRCVRCGLTRWMMRKAWREARSAPSR